MTKLESELVCKSADNPDSLTGDSVDLLIVDEAAQVKDYAMDLVMPSLADKSRIGRMIAISTPRGANWFRDWYIRGLSTDPKWNQVSAFRAPTMANPHVKEWFWQQAAETVPEVIFRQEYLAEFIDDGGDVFKYTDDIFFRPGFYTPRFTENIVIGLDIGKSNDFTVATAFTPTLKMIDMMRLNHKNPSYQIQKMAEFIIKWVTPNRRVYVVMDATSLQAYAEHYLKDKLKQANVDEDSVTIIPVTISNKYKVEYTETLVMEVYEENIAIWDNENIKEEMRAYKMYRTDKLNQTTYAAESGKHDDIITSMGIAVHYIKHNNVKSMR